MSASVTSLGKSRVLFGNNGVYAVKVESSPAPRVEVYEVVCLAGAKLNGADLMPKIESARKNNPVLDGAISARNIEDSAVTIAKINPNSNPLPVTSGGTGLDSIADGDFLTGSSAESLQNPAGVKWIAGATPVLRVLEEIRIGSGAIRVQDDAYGRKSLFSISSANIATNLVAPLLGRPMILNNQVSVSGNNLQVQVSGGFPVDVFFAWARTSDHTVLNRESVVSPGRANVFRSDRIRFRGKNPSYQVTGASPGVYNVFAVLRDARGTCSEVAKGTATIT